MFEALIQQQSTFKKQTTDYALIIIIIITGNYHRPSTAAFAEHFHINGLSLL